MDIQGVATLWSRKRAYGRAKGKVVGVMHNGLRASNGSKCFFGLASTKQFSDQFEAFSACWVWNL